MKMNKKKPDYVKIILTFIAVFSFVYCGIEGYKLYIEKSNAIPSVEKLKEEKKKNNYPKEEPEVQELYVNELPKYRAQYNNEDIKGKLEIPGLNISALVVRSTNNEYYLNYSLNKQYDTLGVPFFDYRNKDLNNNRQINIYGHNTPVKRLEQYLPLINLEAYLDKNMFDNYKNMYLSIDERKIKYETAAIKIVTARDPEHMKLVFSGDQDYLNHTQKLFSNTLYKNDNLNITPNDKLIVLQICHYNPKNSYLLVIGKEV